MAQAGGWIWPDNLNPLLDELGFMAGETLDEGLRALLLDDLKRTDTDADPPVWTWCVFDGLRPIRAQLGMEPGAGLLLVQLEVPAQLKVRAETLLGLMQDYTFTRRP